MKIKFKEYRVNLDVLGQLGKEPMIVRKCIFRTKNKKEAEIVAAKKRGKVSKAFEKA